MFDFQKLDVYQKAKEFNKDITKTLASKAFDRVTNDQLRRASFSIMLNIAEGSSRFSKKDRRNFLVVSRGSAFECAAVWERERAKRVATFKALSHFNQLWFE